MQKRSNWITFVFFTVFSLLMGPVAVAQSQTNTGDRYVRESVEGMNLRIQVDDQNNVVAVRIVECESCQPTTFLPSPQLVIEHGEGEITVEDALRLNGRAGVVLYHPDTEMAEIVLFYGQ